MPGSGAITWTDNRFVFLQMSVYSSVADNTTHNVTLAYTPIQGNLMVMVACSDTTINVPAGWTRDINQVNTAETSTYSKVAGASESTTVTLTLTSSDCAAIVIMEFAALASNIIDKTSTSTSSAGTETMTVGPTATTTAANEIAILSWGAWNKRASLGGSLQAPITSVTGGFTQVAYATGITNGVNANVELAVFVQRLSGTQTVSSTLIWVGDPPNTNNGQIATYK